MTIASRLPVRPLALACFLVLSAGLTGGCNNVTVRRAGPVDLLDAWRASLVTADNLSPRTLQTLRQLDLDGVYRRSAAEAYVRLEKITVNDPQPDWVFALAELSYLLGRQAEKRENVTAMAYYCLSAGYAYHYLFDCPAACGGPGSRADALATSLWKWNAFDPRFRLACDLYNTGLAKGIRAAQRLGPLGPGKQLRLPTPDGRGFLLSVTHHGFTWQAEEFGPLLFCADFRVDGLTNEYRGYGLGVPLIGTLVGSEKGVGSLSTARNTARADAGRLPTPFFYPKDVSFPVTALFRFDGNLSDLHSQHSGRLELYNPLDVQAVDIGRQVVPLQTDLTTPLAYFLSRTDLNGLDLEGFLRADKVQKRSGIYMFEPYQPGKIPVVMVHGLLSSPLTWAPMFNDLRADPELRKHFQFWFYLYPTSEPYFVTAADLRRTLADLRNDVDPRRQDAALDAMVLVGHSMGGLLSRLLTVDSRDDFWKLVSSEPLDRLTLRPDTRQTLEQTFFFQRESFVRRVIFLATPHHGSSLSPSPPARLLAKLVHAPKQLMNATKELAQDNAQALVSARDGTIPTSLDLLAPHAPALELLAGRPLPAGVHYHSIIGVLPHINYLPVESLLPGGNSKEGTDGVVPYASAHLEGVDSEIVVPTDHLRVHHHPLAVQEVRRILMEHLQTLEQEVIPVGGGDVRPRDQNRVN
jgi:pimeloyl-ACP methyl ester carboxylesterase